MSTINYLQKLVDRFLEAKKDGSLEGASEATMRTWIDELLSVFGWNVQDTHQVLTERTLDKEDYANCKIEIDCELVDNLSENIAIRTTFHPDSDYSSFIGCYKPIQHPNEGHFMIFTYLNLEIVRTA